METHEFNSPEEHMVHLLEKMNKVFIDQEELCDQQITNEEE